MLARAGETDVDLPRGRVADHRGAGASDDRCQVPDRSKVNEHIAFTAQREGEVGSVARDRKQIAAHWQRSDVGDIVLHGAEVDRERAAIRWQEQFLGVVGIPICYVLYDVRAAIDDI